MENSLPPDAQQIYWEETPSEVDNLDPQEEFIQPGEFEPGASREQIEEPLGDGTFAYQVDVIQKCLSDMHYRVESIIHSTARQLTNRILSNIDNRVLELKDQVMTVHNRASALSIEIEARDNLQVGRMTYLNDRIMNMNNQMSSLSDEGSRIITNESIPLSTYSSLRSVWILNYV